MRRLAEWGNRIVTRRRARSYAAIVFAVFALNSAYPLTQSVGLVDGYGRVIGEDLLTLRLAAQMVLEGDGGRLYDFALQAARQQAAVEPGRLPGLNPFITPPFAALLFVPLAPLSHPVAFVGWTLLSLAALAGTLALVARHHGSGARSHWRLGFLISLSFLPVIEGLLAGNTSALSLLLYGLTYVSLRSGREVLAGALLGAQLFKPQLALVALVVLVYKRRWRALGGFAAAALGWIGLSAAFVGPDALTTYVALLPSLTGLAFVEGFPYYLLCSLPSFFAGLLGPGGQGLATVLGGLAALGVLGVLLRAWSGPWEPRSVGFGPRFAGLLVATPLVSQYFMLHDLAILILAAWLLAEHYLARADPAGWAATRTVLAVVWVACLLGPLVGVPLRVSPVPLALLFLGWWVWRTWREEREEARAGET